MLFDVLLMFREEERMMKAEPPVTDVIVLFSWEEIEGWEELRKLLMLGKVNVVSSTGVVPDDSQAFDLLLYAST